MSPVVAETISLREVADRLGVHYMTAYRYVRSGRLPAHKVDDEWRVDAADLAALRPTANRSGASSRSTGRRGAPDRDAMRRRLESRMVVGDEVGAWGVVQAALGAGAPAEEVLTGMIAPALRSIGARWAEGSIQIADEHRASTVATRLVSRLGPSIRRPGRKRGTVVLGSVAGDRHGLPTAIMGDLLRGAAFDVIDLGPDSPAESFVATASGLDRVVAVGVCVSSVDLLDGVAGFVEELRSGLPGVPVLVGGGAVDSADLAERLGSDGYASTPEEVVGLFASVAAAVVD